MHELPYALPFRHNLQQTRTLGSAAGVVLRPDAIAGSRFPRRHSHGGIN